MFTKIFHKTKAMPRITKIDSKIINWTTSICNTCSEESQDYKKRFNFHFLNCAHQKFDFPQTFIKWKIFISPFHYSLSTLFHPPSFPIIASPYHGYDNETYTTVRGMIEGMIAQNEGMMGMAGTSNTWKLMVCSLPSCCFVAMQRRQERL